jgi:hypothetical protein
VQAAGNVAKRSNQLGGAIEEEGVFEKEVGKKVKATGFQVSGSMGSRCCGGHKKFNGIQRATKGESDKGGAGSSV